jgi:2-polyprenyl-6-methoxyphenol hydroxylase-like FAD-dependent oxidoreductase
VTRAVRVLISGASIAGPVLAYWLNRCRYAVTVVERAPAPRRTGGHAVDLLGPALAISEKMGVLGRIRELATGTHRLAVTTSGLTRPIEIDLTRLFGAASDRHVEIMRDDLSEIYHDATRDDVEYHFGDRITGISPGGDVTFEHGAPARFDLVIGADGLHSGVRRLVFGDEARHIHLSGAYLAALSVPKELGGRDGEMRTYLDPGHQAAIYSARHLTDARAAFLFRSADELQYHHRDVPRQKELLRHAFTGMHPDVDELLGHLEQTPAFYFDTITQLDLASWSRGRVTLVGDAGYCPGPAIAGSTSLAVVGAHVLAGELDAAGGDHALAFPAYEREMAELVRRSRAFARRAAKALIPNSRLGVWALIGGARLLAALPRPIGRAIAGGNTRGPHLYDAMPVPATAPRSASTTSGSARGPGARFRRGPLDGHRRP